MNVYHEPIYWIFGTEWELWRESVKQMWFLKNSQKLWVEGNMRMPNFYLIKVEQTTISFLVA